METKFLDKSENDSAIKTLPRYLYKYYSNLDYVLDAIVKRHIHLEVPSDYNDVFDSARVVDEEELKYIPYNNQSNMIIAETKCEYQELVQSLLSNCNSELIYIEDVCNYLINRGVPKAIIKNVKLRICSSIKNPQPINNKITCFTQKNDSLLMWAHYGNHLKGACLCFDTRKDMKLFSHVHKVEYTKQRNREQNYNFYYYKATEWRYEKEWRIVAKTKESFINTNSCVGVILGEKTSYENDLLIKGRKYSYSNYLKVAFVANQEGLNVYKALSSHSQYKIFIAKTIDSNYKNN